MAGATTLVEETILDAMFRHAPTTTISGSNASVSSILVSSSTGFKAGHIVKGTAAGSYHLVTSVPDATHINVSPSFAAAPTTGSLETWAWSPAAVYVGLFTTNPTDGGGGSEVSGGDYSRKQLAQATGTWSAPSGTPRLIDNAAAIEWLSVTWSGTVTGWGLFNAASGGDLMWWFDSADVAVSSTDNVRFVSGALDLTVD